MKKFIIIIVTYIITSAIIAIFWGLDYIQATISLIVICVTYLAIYISKKQ